MFDSPNQNKSSEKWQWLQTPNVSQFLSVSVSVCVWCLVICVGVCVCVLVIGLAFWGGDLCWTWRVQVTVATFFWSCLPVLSSNRDVMTPCSVSWRRLTRRDRHIRPRRAHALSRWGWAGKTRRSAHRPRPFQDVGRHRLPGSSCDRSDPRDTTCLCDKRQSAGALVSSVEDFGKAPHCFLLERQHMEFILKIHSPASVAWDTSLPFRHSLWGRKQKSQLQCLM